MLPKTTDMDIQISFAPIVFIGAAVISFVTAWIGSMKPAKKAGAISPIEAVRYTVEDLIKKKSRKSKHGGKPFTMALRNVFRNKKSAVITFASLIIGMTIFMLTTGLLSSLSAENFVKDWGESDFVVTYDFGKIVKKPISISLVDKIKQIKGVKNVRTTTAFPFETEVVYDPDVFSNYILSFANNPEVKGGTDFSDPEVRQRYTENFFGFIYGIDTEYVKELNHKLNTPVDIAQFESGKLVLLCEVLDQTGSSVYTPGKNIQIKNPATGKNVAYQIAPGFLDAGFQSTRGSSRGTAPNMYISQ
jgi:putative ABC transport system permease protein